MTTDNVCAMTGEPLIDPVTIPVPDLRLKTSVTLLSRAAADDLARHIYKQRGIADTRKRVQASRSEAKTVKTVTSMTLENLTADEQAKVAAGCCPKCGANIKGFRRGGADDSELVQTQRAHGINPDTGHKQTCAVQAFKIAGNTQRGQPVARDLKSDGERHMRALAK